jgi:hypothetical protein
LISALVRQAIGSYAMKLARRVVGQGEPSDVSLGRLEALFLEEIGEPLLPCALNGERAIHDELIRRIGAGDLAIFQMASSPSADLGAPRIRVPSWYKLWIDLQRVMMLELMNQAVDIERQEMAKRPALWNAHYARLEGLNRNEPGKYLLALTIKMFPALSGGAYSSLQYQCELRATAILLAAERHRRKHGKWPASIADIDRSILPSEPLDPFSGNSFHMARRDGQLLIYSVGPNRNDEYGAYDGALWLRGSNDDVGAGLWDVHLRRQPPSPDDDPLPQ